MSKELIKLFDAASRDDTVRAVVVTGHGNAFCAGADLTGGGLFASDEQARDAVGMADVNSHRDEGGQVTLSIIRCRKPVIAAINGSAVGIGITMAMAMDMRVVAEDAKIGFVFCKRGIVPEACSSYILPRIVGITKACELVFTGRIFSPTDEPALFNYITTKKETLEKARSLAKEISENSAPSSVALAKALLWKGLSAKSPEEAHFTESKIIHWCFTQSLDAKEGISSFLQKRKPSWHLSPWTGLPSTYPWWTNLDTTPPMARL
eukprot:TRINITY_DN5690_c0_g1_i13.p1 TRINITY_DN5690_c0_g1~~TRINITY_DN5690_c0_g1_i13.p1  ORF type:complete len:285 (-),score=52.62 TRINITY_DN5690_c0_g1_i13:84-875(-)